MRRAGARSDRCQRRSSALNDGWRQADIADVIVAVPAKMVASSFFEFGDGQANAALLFPLVE